MKVCPIGQARAFDDATVCYGCLYEFKDEEPNEAAPPTAAGETPPSFLIKLMPEKMDSGLVSWTCSVDLVSA